jgi:acyl carrier protein
MFKQRGLSYYFIFLEVIIKWFFAEQILHKNGKIERKQIETKVKEILCYIMDLDNNTISKKSNLKQLGANSQDQYEFIMNIEQEFNIDCKSLDPDFVYNVSIESLCKYIENASDKKNHCFQKYIFFSKNELQYDK